MEQERFAEAMNALVQYRNGLALDLNRRDVEELRRESKVRYCIGKVQHGQAKVLLRIATSWKRWPGDDEPRYSTAMNRNGFEVPSLGTA